VLDLVKPLVLLLHVLAAFAYVAGYIATNVLTELARRTDDPAFRRESLRFSTRFDRLLNAPGGMVVAITGVATALIFGYSLLSGWVLVAREIDRAATAGDDAAVQRELRRPRNVAISRLENLVLLAIIVLMVIRPS